MPLCITNLVLSIQNSRNDKTIYGNIIMTSPATAKRLYSMENAPRNNENAILTTKAQILIHHQDTNWCDPCGLTKVPPMPNMNMGPNSNIVRRAITKVMNSTVNLSHFYLIISKCHGYSTPHESSPPYGHLFELC